MSLLARLWLSQVGGCVFDSVTALTRCVVTVVVVVVVVGVGLVAVEPDGRRRVGDTSFVHKLRLRTASVTDPHRDRVNSFWMWPSPPSRALRALTASNGECPHLSRACLFVGWLGCVLSRSSGQSVRWTTHGHPRNGKLAHIHTMTMTRDDAEAGHQFTNSSRNPSRTHTTSKSQPNASP